MPLWRPYDAMIEGTVGDLNNSGTGSRMAGSITAALFLRRFVDKAKAWAHFDVYAWNPKPRAHGPAGGEIQAARALFELLCERFRASEPMVCMPVKVGTSCQCVVAASFGTGSTISCPGIIQ